MKNKTTLLNIISNIILQITNIIAGFIIPKIILSYFGSNVNGLVSSILQFLSYITLIEGGISAVIMASLYKPLNEKDYNRVSSILYTSSNFYKKIGFIFIIYTIILAILYPILFNTGFQYFYVFTLIIVLSISLIIQYMFSLTYKNLLTSDKKGYVVSVTQTVILILTMLFSYISVKVYPSIHILKLLSGILFVLQPIIYSSFIQRNYKLNNNKQEDKKLISQRWNGFAINIAAFIHNSTDIAILTIFTNLVTVSIYSVYTIVTRGLKSIIDAVSSALVPVIGKAYASEDYNDLNIKLDLYEYIIFLLVFFMFTLAGLLITPFVMIYTKGITDANYNQVLFGVLLVLSEALYIIKFPHLNLAYSANKFKELTIPAFLEAGINIIVSLILVSKLGLIGVAIGTICGMLYRMIYHVYFTSKMIETRKQSIFYKKLLIFSCATIIGIIISIYLISPTKFSILSWILHAIIYSLLFGTIYLVLSIVFFKKELNYFKKYLFNRQ